MLKRDRTQHLVFSPLQTAFARDVLEKQGKVQSLATVVLIDDAGAHEKVTAAFRSMMHLGFPYTLVGRVGLLIPSALLDPMYDLLGRNLGTVSRYWPFDHDIESYRCRMLGLEGKTVAEASAQFGKS